MSSLGSGPSPVSPQLSARLALTLSEPRGTTEPMSAPRCSLSKKDIKPLPPCRPPLPLRLDISALATRTRTSTGGDAHQASATQPSEDPPLWTHKAPYLRAPASGLENCVQHPGQSQSNVQHHGENGPVHCPLLEESGAAGDLALCCWGALGLPPSPCTHTRARARIKNNSYADELHV